jgi:hypothetical protein
MYFDDAALASSGSAPMPTRVGGSENGESKPLLCETGL